MTQTLQRTGDRQMRRARTVWERVRDRAAGRAHAYDEPDEAASAETYRAMDLALRVGELLLASGEATENVSEAMRSLSVAYGLPRSEAAVTFTAISLSCVPTDGAPPVTGERSVRRRLPDYERLAATHRLVEEAAMGLVELDDAFDRLRVIKRARPPYPALLITLSLPLISASASVLSGGGALVAMIAFAATLVADRAGAWLGRRGIAEFYQLAVGAAIGSLIAVLVIAAGMPVQASAVVVGSIMALLPGRPLVAAVQDGISGAMVSAGARLLEVFFIVAALVTGVGLTVYGAVHLGLPLSVEDLPTSVASYGPVPVLGAVAMAVTFAISLAVPRRALATAAVGGAVIWLLYATLRHAGMMPVLAAGVAAAAVGLVAHLIAARHRSPALPYTVPLIGPLLPGTPLYRGLLQISHNDLNQGLLSLFTALATAFALAAGISLGGELVRAFRRGGTVGTSPRRRPAARRTRGY
ncbi:MAG TPA: threonine/serine exporter family protein [Actinocatenispora sp.]